MVLGVIPRVLPGALRCPKREGGRGRCIRRPTCAGGGEDLHPRPLAGRGPEVRPCCAPSSLAAGEEGASAPSGPLGGQQGPGKHTAPIYAADSRGEASPLCEPVPPAPVVRGRWLSAAHRSEPPAARRAPLAAQ